MGEFGSAVPVWPWRRERCPRGHRLAVAGGARGYHHLYGLQSASCRVCIDLKLFPAEWCELDPGRQVTTDQATGQGMELVITPPVMRGAVGTIALHLDGRPRGDVDAALCTCRVGLIEGVRVDAGYRRLGFGRVLLYAALIRGPGYRWSTTAIDTAEAWAFWAAVAPDFLMLGASERCTDMRTALAEP